MVSDEQLQSKLRVSILAVVVPAYRSFLGRFLQFLDAGRLRKEFSLPLRKKNTLIPEKH